MSIKDEAFAILQNKAAKLYKLDPATITEDTRFVEDLNSKSVHVVQFSAALEDEFEIEVPFMIFKDRPTLGDVAAYIGEQFGE
jgi:acyl carrier protein